MPTAPRITGAFLDEITHDIPSQNWGAAEWRREFELYRRIGIDTVIIIRAGYRNRCIFPSSVVPGLLPVYEDLGRIFLDLSEEFGLKLFFGLYDSGLYWHRRSWWKEVELNLAFIDEVVERYGASPAFGGWYMCHETGRNDAHIIELFNHMGRHCKKALPRPVLISPYPMGSKLFAEGAAFTLEESMEHWRRIFAETRGAFDICAFQDGQVQYHELPDFLRGVSEIAAEFGVEQWSNLETFDRDMPIKFPPADWRYLRYKLEAAAQVAQKIITFEFAHFMSPHSCYPAAHNLFARYRDFAGLD
jgi:hypothetical protein